MKKIGIIGSRRRNSDKDFDIVEMSFLTAYEKDSIIISGGCPKGGDRFAEDIAKKFDVSIRIFKPDWERFGRGAGFVRNTDIAENSDVLIACVASDRKGGTEDTIEKFMKTHQEIDLILC